MNGLSSRSGSPFRLSCPSPTRNRLSLKGNPAYAPSSAAQDLSRILDPAYAQPRRSSDTGRPPSPVAAYVDNTGELHDPDFRDFPAFPSAAGASAFAGDRSPRAAVRSASTSRYALDACAAARGDEEDDASVYRRDPSAWAAPRRLRPYSASYHHSPVLGHSPLFGGGSGSPTLGGSPQSDVSDEAPLRRASRASRATAAAYLDESEQEVDEDDPLGLDRPRRRRLHKWGRAKRTRESHEEESDLEETPVEEEKTHRKPRRPWRVTRQEEKTQPLPAEEKQTSRDNNDDDDDVPSCTYALRRQYIGLSLRIRTGVFHAKRRFRRRLRS